MTRSRKWFLPPPAHSSFWETGGRLTKSTTKCCSAKGRVRTVLWNRKMNEIKDPKVMAMMGFETGIGFLPFAGTGYEVFKRIHKDDGSPIRAAAARELAADRDPRIGAALAKTCSDRKWSVRDAAVVAIAKRDDP